MPTGIFDEKLLRSCTDHPERLASSKVRMKRVVSWEVEANKKDERVRRWVKTRREEYRRRKMDSGSNEKQCQSLSQLALSGLAMRDLTASFVRLIYVIITL